MNVLLVADSPWVINQVRSALDGSHNVIEIADPHEAENAVVGVEADVILADMQVGTMGGMALVRSMRGVAIAGEAEDAPIILLLDRSADEFIAKRSGAAAWILKPFSPQDLAATLATVIPAGVDHS